MSLVRSRISKVKVANSDCCRYTDAVRGYLKVLLEPSEHDRPKNPTNNAETLQKDAHSCNESIACNAISVDKLAANR